MNSRSIYVVIPAYNEEETVGDLIKGLKRLNLDLKIIVVDDGSKDKTAEKAREAGAIVVKHVVNLGQWAALKTAFIISLLSDADIIVTLDADGQHKPEDIYFLVDPVLQGEADLVIGSRFMNQSKPVMHKHRYFGIKFFNKIMRLNNGLKLSDCTSGYKAYRANLVAQLLLD
jgi:glycosyltransferase involved in cell wall biosynthesis